MSKGKHNYSSRFYRKEKFVIQWLYDTGFIDSLCVKKDVIDDICGDLFHSFNHREIVSKMYYGIIDNVVKLSCNKIVVSGKIVIGNDRNKSKPQVIKCKKKVKDFYSTREWRELRADAFIKYGRHCCLCGRGVEHGIVLHVDHIKPRSKYPHLELDLDNLQILCEDCNLGKSNRYEDDWRLETKSSNLYKD